VFRCLSDRFEKLLKKEPSKEAKLFSAGHAVMRIATAFASASK
jgi:hypothetical protein